MPTVLLRHAVSKEHRQLRVDQTPVLTPAGPFSGNVHHGQIQHFQQTVVRGKDRLGFGDLPKLAVETLDGVGGIDQPANLLGILEVGAQMYPVVPPGREILGYFLSQR